MMTLTSTPSRIERLRVAFMGSDAIALPLLEWLAGQGATQVELIGVFTQPDRPIGRGQKVAANAIKTWARAHGLPVHQPEKLTGDVRTAFAATSPDLALVMAYGHILRDAFIATPRLGTLNLHASILPHYRGASPIQTAIASGETETGVSLMRIVRELDAGPVADVERVPIAPHDTASEIEAKLAAASVPLVARNLSALASGALPFVEQEHAAATFCRRLAKDDGGLDFAQPAAVLAARINGLYPWPGCRFEFGGQIIKVGLAESDNGVAPVGEVVDAGVDAGLTVGTGRGRLRLLKLQRPGGKMLPASEFLRGCPMTAGSMIASTPMPPLMTSRP